MTVWNPIYRSFNDESFSADWAKLVFRHYFEKLRVFDFGLFLEILESSPQESWSQIF